MRTAHRVLLPPALRLAEDESVPDHVREIRATHEQVKRRCTIALVAANVLGAAITFALGVFVVPSQDELNEGVLRSNLILFLAIVPVGIVLGTLLSVRTSRPGTDWLLEGREPRPGELSATLTYPRRQAMVEGALWLGAAVPFTILNAGYSAALGVETAVSILLGGVTTVALAYLLAERMSRPVFAYALERAQQAPGAGGCPSVASRLTLAWAVGASVPLVSVGLVGLTALLDVPASRERIGLAVMVVAVAGIVVGLFVIATAARSLTEPLTALRQALGEVERGDLSAAVQVDDASEIGRLQSGFNQMVGGLRERDRLLDLFGRQVGEEVAREALERDGVELGGETREAAVLFVDLIGSTRLAARWEPQEVVAELNAFFRIVVDCVSMHGGWVNKFEGDAALCVFGAPTMHPDAAGAALSAGRLLRSRLDSELPELRAAIGVSAGEVVAGNVGAAERYEYTVIGDPVNEAARLTEMAKTVEGRLLASDAALERAQPRERDRWVEGEAVTLRGRDRETVVATPA